MIGPGILYLLIAVGFAVHAMKTGRPFWWLYIILFVPVAGWLAYIAIELLPSMFHTRGAQRVRSNIGTILDPNREWRERVRQAELVDSADAKRALAEECEKRGLWDDAIRLYKAAGTGVFADDPTLLAGRVRSSEAATPPPPSIRCISSRRLSPIYAIRKPTFFLPGRSRPLATPARPYRNMTLSRAIMRGSRRVRAMRSCS
jgi:hypothetical protein